MREIRFRGKRVSNGEWVHGGIVKSFHPNFPTESEVAFFAQRPNAYAICVNNKDYFVKQGTIGQFTGMKDKRGNKIYEGDIVKTNIDLMGIVRFDIGYYFEWITDSLVSMWNKDMKVWVEWGLEVIGNIYENKELIEKSS